MASIRRIASFTGETISCSKRQANRQLNQNASTGAMTGASIHQRRGSTRPYASICSHRTLSNVLTSTTGDGTFVSVALTGESTGKPKCYDRRIDRRINFKHPRLTGNPTGNPTGEPTAKPKHNDSRSDRRVNSIAAWEEGKTHCAG